MYISTHSCLTEQQTSSVSSMCGGYFTQKQRALRANRSICVLNPDVKMVVVKRTDVIMPSAGIKFFGAGTAGCIADLITFPLDTAKVRLQVRRVVLNRFLHVVVVIISKDLILLHRSRANPRRLQGPVQ